MSAPLNLAPGQVWTGNGLSRLIVRVDDGSILSNPSVQYEDSKGRKITAQRRAFCEWVRLRKAVQQTVGGAL